MMIKNVLPPTAEFAASKTVVWWDLDTCPLPNGYDPSRLVPRIDTQLRNLGYNGPLTIIALGDLGGIPDDFLRVLSAAGVVIKHIPYGNMSIMRHFNNCETVEESPVTVMVISNPVVVSSVSFNLLEREGGYNLLLAYPPTCPPEFTHHPSLVVCGEWHWTRQSLLKDSGYDVQTRTLNKGCEMFSCISCYFDCPTIEDLIEHVQCEQHLLKSLWVNKANEGKFHLVARQEAKARRKMKAEEQSKICVGATMLKGNNLETEGEAKKKPRQVKEKAKAKKKARKQSKGKSLETEGEDQIRSIRQKWKIPEENKVETEEEEAECSLRENPTAKPKANNNVEIEGGGKKIVKKIVGKTH